MYQNEFDTRRDWMNVLPSNSGENGLAEPRFVKLKLGILQKL